jgi:hypothetical protein
MVGVALGEAVGMILGVWLAVAVWDGCGEAVAAGAGVAAAHPASRRIRIASGRKDFIH